MTTATKAPKFIAWLWKAKVPGQRSMEEWLEGGRGPTPAAALADAEATAKQKGIECSRMKCLPADQRPDA